MSKRLRVAHVLVQPVLVWDDGEEMTPGPGVEPMQLPLTALADLAEQIRTEVARAEAEALGPPADG